MELIILNRVCIPYVAEVKSTKKVAAKPGVTLSITPPLNSDQEDDDFVTLMENIIENIQHSMKLMLSPQWRQWRI